MIDQVGFQCLRWINWDQLTENTLREGKIDLSLQQGQGDPRNGSFRFELGFSNCTQVLALVSSSLSCMEIL